MGIHEATVSALLAASKGKDLTKVSGLWDTLAEFAKATGMEFPATRRDAIMTAASSLASVGKGRMNGSTATVTYRVAVGAAWAAAVKHAESKGATKESLKAWADDWKRLSSVSQFAKGAGSLKFEV